MKALIIGATGATGKDLLQKLLKDDDFSQVDIFVRKPINMEHEKLTTHIVDFNKPEDWKDLVTGDVAFSCLGTTLKAAGSKDAQWKIDFEYQYNFAKCAKENGVPCFVLVSAYGANPKSKVFYSKMKGDLEVAIEKLSFEKTIIFHPGMLVRKNTDRPMETLGIKIIKAFNKIGILKTQKPLPTEILAQAMINSSKNAQPGITEINLNKIFDAAN